MREKWLVVHDKSGQGLWAFNLADVVRIRLTVQRKDQWWAVMVLSFRDGTVWVVHPTEPADTAEEAYASALPVFRRIVAAAATTESNLVEVAPACLPAERIQ
jgi:predicted P-loop ATPase